MISTSIPLQGFFNLSTWLTAIAGAAVLLLVYHLVTSQGLKRSRRETAAVSQDRDDLLDQRAAARASTASTPGNGSQGVGPDPRPDRDRGWPRLFGHRTATSQASPQRAAAPPAETLNPPPAADVPAGASAPADASATAD